MSSRTFFFRTINKDSFQICSKYILFCISQYNRVAPQSWGVCYSQPINFCVRQINSLLFRKSIWVSYLYLDEQTTTSHIGERFVKQSQNLYIFSFMTVWFVVLFLCSWLTLFEVAEPSAGDISVYIMGNISPTCG